MGWLDVVIYIILVASVVQGIREGAVGRVAQWAAVLIAFDQSWRVSPWVRDLLLYLNVDVGLLTGTFVLVASFILVFAGLSLLGRWLSSLVSGGIVGVLNRVLGGALGLVIVVLALGYAFEIWDRLIPPSSVGIRAQSDLYRQLRHSTTDLEDITTYMRSLFPNN